MVISKGLRYKIDYMNYVELVLSSEPFLCLVTGKDFKNARAKMRMYGDESRNFLFVFDLCNMDKKPQMFICAKTLKFNKNNVCKRLQVPLSQIHMPGDPNEFKTLINSHFIFFFNR